MPRPAKIRRICKEPETRLFSPSGKNRGTVTVTVDELEIFGLMDEKLLTQNECAELCNIARTTVTAIYESARRKIACALCNGYAIKVEGGHYEVCDHSDTCAGKCVYLSGRDIASREIPETEFATRKEKSETKRKAETKMQEKADEIGEDEIIEEISEPEEKIAAHAPRRSDMSWLD